MAQAFHQAIALRIVRTRDGVRTIETFGHTANCFVLKTHATTGYLGNRHTVAVSPVHDGVSGLLLVLVRQAKII